MNMRHIKCAELADPFHLISNLGYFREHVCLLTTPVLFIFRLSILQFSHDHFKPMEITISFSHNM